MKNRTLTTPWTPSLAISGIRQFLRIFANIAFAYGPQSYHWVSKESLRERPLGLRREVKSVPISHKGLDLAKIGRDHPDVRRFYVIGYDLFQVPVFRMAFVRTGDR